jgi:hypothetical protein
MTNKSTRHDFQEFMDLVKIQLSAGYFNISKRTKEDPGTAGDQAEEDWASFLREWLPATYQVVTKGRIINPEGIASPQIDILVLHPNYPKKLLAQKHYFSGGVVAAFECKLNARPSDIKRAFESASIIKKLISPSVGNPFDELYHSPFYGLLAHTTTIKDRVNNGVYGVINKYRTEFAEHPREMLDIICINTDSTYALKKYVFISNKASEYGREVLKEMNLKEAICTMYLMECEFEGLPSSPRNSTGFNLAALLCYVTTYMAYLDPSIRPFADFLNNIDGSGGIGLYDYWNLNNLSSGVIEIIKKQGFSKDGWSKWSEQFEPL